MDVLIPREKLIKIKQALKDGADNTYNLVISNTSPVNNNLYNKEITEFKQLIKHVTHLLRNHQS